MQQAFGRAEIRESGVVVNGARGFKLLRHHLMLASR